MNIINPNLVAYCGLCCLESYGFKGRIPYLARDLRKELRDSKHEKFADFISKKPFGKRLENYKECYNILGFMVKFPLNEWAARTAEGLPSARSGTATKRWDLLDAGSLENSSRAEN